MTHIANDQMSGVDVAINALSNGTWMITVPGDGNERGQAIGQGDTLEKAKAQARTWVAKRKVKVAVPFFSPTTGQAGIATGLHARTRSVLVRYDDGETDQIMPHTTVLGGDTPREKVEEMTAAQDEVRRLRGVARDIQEAHELKLGAAVERAIEEKIQENEVNQ